MLSFFLFVCKLLPQISSSMHCCLCIIDVRSPMRWHSFLWYSASLFFTLKSFHLRIEQPAVVRAWRNVIDYGCLFWPLSSRAAIHFKRRLGFFGGFVLFKKTQKTSYLHTNTHTNTPRKYNFRNCSPESFTFSLTTYLTPHWRLIHPSVSYPQSKGGIAFAFILLMFSLFTFLPRVLASLSFILFKPSSLEWDEWE